MKRDNFYVKLLTVFITGLLLCGVGAGVCFVEWSALEIVKAEETRKTDERQYTLPQNEKLYLYGPDADITLSDSAEPGVMTIKVGCEERGKSYFFDQEQKILIEDSRIGHYEWNVKALEMPHAYYPGDDFSEFKEMLEHLKKKEIYYRDYEEPKVEIVLYPADRDRVICMWEHNNMWLEDPDYYEDDYIEPDMAAEYTEDPEEVFDDEEDGYEDELEDEYEAEAGMVTDAPEPTAAAVTEPQMTEANRARTLN